MPESQRPEPGASWVVHVFKADGDGTWWWKRMTYAGTTLAAQGGYASADAAHAAARSAYPLDRIYRLET